MNQIGDQAGKGGIAAVISYLIGKYDPALAALSVPVVVSILAILSKKVGDPSVAAFIAPKTDETAGQ